VAALGDPPPAPVDTPATWGKPPRTPPGVISALLIGGPSYAEGVKKGPFLTLVR
jgi:hypothetical protein